MTQSQISKNDKERAKIMDTWTAIREDIANMEETREVLTRDHPIESTSKQPTLTDEVQIQDKSREGKTRPTNHAGTGCYRVYQGLRDDPGRIWSAIEGDARLQLRRHTDDILRQLKIDPSTRDGVMITGKYKGKSVIVRN